MTTHERFHHMFEHKEADRIPLIDTPWPATLERWHREGMPEKADWIDYFGFDRMTHIRPDTTPQLETAVVEETEEYIVTTSAWGATVKNFKHTASVPEQIDFRIKTADDWYGLKDRLKPDVDRIDWADLRKNYPVWRERGDWITARFSFGFDVTHARVIGTERFLQAMATDPEWCLDIFETQLDLCMDLFDMVWKEGFRFDAVWWPDDMGYKGKQFFSPDMYRDMLKPFHQRAVDWAHAKGVKAMLHSCGDIRPFLPDLVGTGVDSLNPLEVKAGIDPLEVKREFGGDLVLHGGINAVLWDKPDQIKAEIERVVPEMKKNGGYIFASDHSIPSSVSLEEMRDITELVKEVGSY